MAWMDARRVAEREQDLADGREQNRVIAARQIRSSNRPRKQRIPDEEIVGHAPSAPDLQADAARTMTGCVMRSGFTGAKRDDVARCVEPIDRRERLDADAEHRGLFGRALVEEHVVAVQVHRDAERPLRRRYAGDMIDVGVRQQDGADDYLPPRRIGEQAVDLVARIDQDALVRLTAGDDESVLEEGADRLRLDYDHVVILALLDDLLFRSKIRTAASRLGVRVAFAGSSEAALTAMRADMPALVILDLDNPRTDPLGTLAVMKADARLTAIPTVAFGSHVQTETLGAARRAGVDEVLPRSAFTARLAEILQRGR
jgi:CheY-like chemotaxis protein